MSKQSKKHHIVPQFLLKNFIENNTTVFLYDKLTDRTEKRNPRSTLVFPNFNTIGGSVELEIFFSNIESRSAPVIKKLIKQKSFKNISQAEKEALLYFVLMQYVRTFVMRDAIEDLFRLLATKMIQSMENKGEHETHDTLPQHFKISDFIEKGLVNIVIDQDHIKITVVELAKYFSEQLPNLMNNKKFGLLFSTDRSFYISDSGICLSGGNSGINSPGVEIYLPMSSKCMLVIGDQSLPLEETKGYLALDEMIEKLNILQTQWAKRYIVCGQDDFEVAKKFLNDYPDLKNDSGRKLAAL